MIWAIVIEALGIAGLCWYVLHQRGNIKVLELELAESIADTESIKNALQKTLNVSDKYRDMAIDSARGNLAFIELPTEAKAEEGDGPIMRKGDGGKD